ncbi:hypothetical protein NC796_21760 [Aliifodinibius sp. S!AR15-10]|uniref:hypothetical protein n=1 Tax=Aliifodinibius sp. S!AR15-10 TaxID=2950437 RepID=UPI0028583E38|nr:hypothetical protein [Aliifodinibius sp. S!AR15-10]MDR8393794.1 hypothetical protein [Aliifodinibius sp. S!AR15-10]
MRFSGGQLYAFDGLQGLRGEPERLFQAGLQLAGGDAKGLFHGAQAPVGDVVGLFKPLVEGIEPDVREHLTAELVIGVMLAKEFSFDEPQADAIDFEFGYRSVHRLMIF